MHEQILFRNENFRCPGCVEDNGTYRGSEALDEEAAEWLTNNMDICGVCQYPMTETKNNNLITRKALPMAIKRGLIVQENLRINVAKEWGK